MKNGHLIPKKQSELVQYKQEQAPVLIDKMTHILEKNKVGEPNKW